MNEDDFEGSLVLEQMALLGRVDDFYDAIDSDDLVRAKTLMQLAGVDPASIAIVLQKMRAAGEEH